MKIVSGAQTGADRGGLDAALELGIEYGGWIPKGRRAEDGRVPDKYQGLVETKQSTYPPRTELNVQNSDATVIFIRGVVGTGSELTAALARKHDKPILHMNLLADLPVRVDAGVVRDFVLRYNVQVLNVAGSRESSAPGIQERVRQILVEALVALDLEKQLEAAKIVRREWEKL